MRIPFGKIKVIFVVATGVALAQETTPPTAPQPPVAETPANAPVDQRKQAAVSPTPSGTDTSAALDYLFNRKPQDGTAGQQALRATQQAEGKAVAEDAVGANQQEDAQLRARFERYLGTAQVERENLDAYFGKMKAVSGLLLDNKLFDAWKQLHELADYSTVDGGISRELANRVESIWTMDQTTASLDRKNQELQGGVKTANRNADMISEQVMQQQLEYQRKLNQTQRKQQQNPPQGQPNNGNNIPPQMPSGGNTAPPTIQGLEGKLQLTEEYLRSLELRAKIKLRPW